MTTVAARQSEVLIEREMGELELRNIGAVFKLCGAKIYGPQGSARLLDLPATTLSARVKSLGVKKR